MPRKVAKVLLMTFTTLALITLGLTGIFNALYGRPILATIDFILAGINGALLYTQHQTPTS